MIAATPSAQADALAWLAAETDRMRTGDGLTLAVVERDGETLRGNIGLRLVADDRDAAEFAYDGAPSARHHDVDAAAVRLLALWALGEWRLARLQLATLVDDAASQRVAAQVGFQREGVLRSWSELGGARLDMVMFSLVPGDL